MESALHDITIYKMRNVDNYLLNETAVHGRQYSVYGGSLYLSSAYPIYTFAGDNLILSHRKIDAWMLPAKTAVELGLKDIQKSFKCVELWRKITI